jgi:hypothetical protein
MKLSVVTPLISVAVVASVPAPPQNCLCLPGDACWPSQDTWSNLNSTVGGKLVATVPIGSPCHDPTYDADACSKLQQDWLNPLIQ